MKHLVLTIHSGWVSYTMGVATGSHPIGDDAPDQVVRYLIGIIHPDTYEVINHN
jgi:hypothetical protein